MTPPIHSPVELAALKTAFRLLVLEVGNLHSAASVSRVGPSMLSDYSNLQKPECFPPADVIAALETVAGRPLVTAEMARLGGYRLVPLEGRSANQDLATMIAASMREASDVMTAFCAALNDAQVCAVDAVHMQREALEAVARFTQLAAELGAIALSAATSSPGAAAPCGGGQPGDRRPPRGDDAGRLPNGSVA